MGKFLLGLILFFGGIVLGIYVGIWLCLGGGIADLINEIKSSQPANITVIVLAILKIFISPFVSLFLFLSLSALGVLLMNSKKS